MMINHQSARHDPFILSPAGQSILLEPEISRLPVRAETYKEGRPDYPNPFDSRLTSKGIRFNTELSRTRYHLVNTLFDTVITYRLKGLSRTWKVIHDAEAAIKSSNYPDLRKRLKDARRLASQIPVNTQQASDPAFTSSFVRRRLGLPVPIHQVNLEQRWERFVRDNHIAAARIAEEILAELAGRQQVTKP